MFFCFTDMIESIPDPLQDAGMKKEVFDHARGMAAKKEPVSMAYVGEWLLARLNDMGKWALAEGFRAGWLLCEKNCEQQWRRTGAFQEVQRIEEELKRLANVRQVGELLRKEKEALMRP